MKLLEVHGTYHPNVKMWITQAKSLAVEELQHVLDDESKRDPQWFVNKRGSRLRQLVSEILTMTLQEVSDEKWTATDFEGHTHSDQISQAINDLVKIIDPIYHQIRTELLTKDITELEPQDHLDPKQVQDAQRSPQIDL